VNIVTTAMPNVKLVASFVSVEENLTGREQNTGTNPTKPNLPCVATVPAVTGGCPTFNNQFFGVSPFQLRGDDWAIILAPEITPIKGLDIKPMFSYFTASGTTTTNARQSRGGISATNWFQNTCSGVADAGCTGNDASGTWRKGINEDRLTVGIDGRYRMGPFSLDPTIMYQFGNVSRLAPTAGSGLFPANFADAGVVPGRKYTADIKAWLIDIRGGYQIGPLLLEAMFMWSSGNSARNTTLGTTRYYQPLTTDTSYLADWGGQLSALGIDYLNAMNEAGVFIAYPGASIGWDKYGRYQIGTRATYAWTPAFSMYGGVNAHWTSQDVQENALQSTSGPIPLWTGQAANLKSQYVGTELFAGLTWRFAPGIALDSAGGYMWMGPAMNGLLTNPSTGARDAQNAYIVTSRIRVSF